MPTKRFLNLKEEKKQIILEAAAHEFARVPYSSASINQIIKEAGISRGSFYTYFEDKDDLMRYMLRGFGKLCEDRIFEIMEEEQGNPFAVPIRFLKQVMAEGNEGIGYRMYRNMLSDLNVVNQNQLFGVQGFLFQDISFMEFLDKLYERMDRNRYPVSRDILAYTVELSILLFVKALTMYYKEIADKEQIITVTENEMRILEKGSCGLDRVHEDKKENEYEA